MVILGIESSCDDFGVAILKNNKIIANIISSQINEHSKFGGVVPELASRLHFENFDITFNEALKKSKINKNQIDYIAYTNNPGLLGSLIIGRIFAKTLAQNLNKKAFGLNHIRGHVASAFIDEDPIYPLLSLVVSGGHTQIVISKSINDYEIVGETLDDAIGECFDKIARKLGFNYPGGAIIDKLSQSINESFFVFPKINLSNFNMSFSGIKTNALNQINKDINIIKNNLNQFCFAFQNACINQVIDKTKMAIDKYKPQALSLAGGVSANSLIRTQILNLGNKYKIKTFIPKLAYCTDNGAMIAKLLQLKLNENKNILETENKNEF